MRRMVIATLLAIVLAGWAGYAASAEDHPADNTGKNVRDRSGHTLTSGDQSSSKPDIKITQEVRKAVVGDKDLSTNAHNVKIITKNGIVTLRGPVNTPEEKASVADKAKSIAGVHRVDNQLEVASH
jgi:hyperosmotically inducible periplasmic protein